MCSKESLMKLISRDEAREIIGKCFSSTKVEIINYEVDFASPNAVGYLGEYLNLTVTVKPVPAGLHGKYSFFIKTLPLHDDPLKQMLTEFGIFEKEAIIYRTIFKELRKYERRKWRPEFYYARKDIIVLENLIPAGYEHIKGRSKFTITETEAVLRSLASLHANSIVYEEKSSLNIGQAYKILGTENSINRIGWLFAGMKSLKSVAKIHPRFQTVQYQSFISEKFEEKLDPIFDIVNESKKYKNVICHRDVWHRNTFFKYMEDSNNVSCLLVDFQICRYCPPAVDVMFTLYCNMSRQDRKDNMKHLLQYYYEELAHELNYFDLDIDTYITWETFLESCSYAELVGVFYAGIVETLTEIPIELQNKLKKDDPEKNEFYTNVDRSGLVLNFLQKNEIYRNNVFSIVEEIVDHLYNA